MVERKHNGKAVELARRALGLVAPVKGEIE
jgi:hypothetical protein